MRAAIWIATLALLLGSGSALATGESRFNVAPDASAVNAKVSFFGIGSRTARFPEMSGSVALSPSHMDRINLDVSINATKLTAGDDLTISRLKGKDFFDVVNHPTIRFAGKDLSMSGPMTGIVRGNLTARGVTRPVILNVTFSSPPVEAANGAPITLTGVTTINRRDFGMTAYSLIVGNKVTISIRTKLVPSS